MVNRKTPSVIRWTRSDYQKLSYAVRQFNKKISELEGLDENVLPEEYKYTDLRDSIYSRRELNRVIKSLRRFSKASQQRIVKTQSGQELTQWEFSELKKAQKRATLNITDLARDIVDSDVNVMGDVEFKKLSRTRESIEDLFNRTGTEFRRTRGRTRTWGKSDYELWRASIFRENFMNSLKEMSKYKNYKLLRDKLESIENPISFYNYVSQSNILSDLFLFYKDKATAQTYGGFVDNQEAFDTAIFDQLGINPQGEDLDKRFKVLENVKITNENIEELKNINKKNYVALYESSRQIGIFTNGEKVYEYIKDFKLSGNIRVKILKSKR